MVPEIPWRLTKSLYSRKERLLTSLTVAEGPPSVTSALEAGADIEFVVVSESFAKSPAYARIERAAGRLASSPRLYRVKDLLFDRISDVRTPQGILCVLPFPFRVDAASLGPWEEPLYLYGFDIQDPGNAGTLIRAAAAAGATAAVFGGESADVFSPKCIRSSAGAAFRVGLEELGGQDPVAVLRGLEEKGIVVYKATPRAGEPPWKARLWESCAIVVGNEARGLSNKVLEGPGQGISIPMPGETESLNVAIASGILLYEAVRQRLLSDPRS